MYTGYFGLTERPFSIAPDPAYLYMSSRHKEAMAHLSYGLLQGGCFIVLTGEVGTGKTTLCRNLLSELPDNVDVALILNANINEAELLQTLCDELKISYTEQQSQKQLLDQINEYLLAAYAENRHTVLIIDEAQLLSRDVLEQIRLLTNLETTKQKLLQIILIGQPELNDVLSRDDLRQLAQRVTARYHLGALRRNEIEDYINYRLSVAGCKQPLFSKQALAQLHALTGGIPRRINVLADHSLLSAYSKTEPLVNAQAVKVAAREVFIAAQTKSGGATTWSSSFARWWLPATLLLLVNIGLWWWFVASNTGPIAATTPPQPTVANQTAESSQPIIETADPPAVAEPAAPQSKLTPVADTGAQSVQEVVTPDSSESNQAAEPVSTAPVEQPVAAIVPESSGIAETEEAAAAIGAATEEVTETAAAEPGPVTEIVVAEAEEASETAKAQVAEAADSDAEVATPSGTALTTITNVAEQPGSMVVSETPLSADPEVIDTGATVLGQILETSADLTGRIAAFRSLGEVWGQSLPDQFLQPACSVVALQGLRCLGVNNWGQLQRLNRPAIIVLSHDDQLHRVVLTSIDDNQAGTLIGGRQHLVDVAEIQRHWTGRAVIFWRPAEIGSSFRAFGDISDEMPALRAVLNQAFSAANLPLLNSVDSQEFDMDMSQKVFAMQSRFSIIADSKIGNETYMLINEILRPDTTPVLFRRSP